jgi:hypothetical protein
MPKSGSTFIFQLAKELCFRHLNCDSDMLFTVKDIFPDVSNPYFLSYEYDLEDFILRAYDLVGNSNEKILIVKLHRACIEDLQEMINAGRIFSISTFRHPQEVALSLVDCSYREKEKGINRFNFFTLEDTIPHIGSSIKNYKSWKSLKYNLNICFDDIATNPYNVAKSICDHIGFNLEIKSVVDFFLENKKKRIWEFNKGMVDRHKIEFPKDLRGLFDSKFYEFNEYVNKFKAQVNNKI